MKLTDLFEAGEVTGYESHPDLPPDQVRPKVREPRYEETMGKEHYIGNPTIMDIEAGNMVTAWEDKPKWHDDVEIYMNTWGMVIRNVDYKKGMVQVSSSPDDGPRVRTEWVPIDDIRVTWNIGGMDKVRSGLKSFGKHFDKWADQRNDDKHGALPGERKPKEYKQ